MSKVSAPPRRTEESPVKFHWLAVLFFPAALLYHELLLRSFYTEAISFDISLLPIIVFSLAAGLAISLLLALLHQRRTARIIAIILCCLWTIFTCIQYCCKSYFKSYFSLGYMGSMTGDVLGDFSATIVEIVQTRIPFILLSLLPLIALIIWRKRILPDERSGKKVLLTMAAAMIILQLCGSLMGNFGAYRAQYTYDFNADNTVPKFGLVTELRLEAEYAIFGIPKAPLVEVGNLVEEESDSAPQPAVYGYNQMDIDFRTLIDTAENNTLLSMHRYFSEKSPTQKNEYTGLFRGKNLILITAEAFSPYAISEELTPTLYQLSHEGFVFQHYYQPAWGQSTTGGEFAVMTGIIPTWINNSLSFVVSSHDSMPFALGNQFRKLGYTTPAWHNNSYNYYHRDMTHPNLGYDYKGIGNGLVLENGGTNGWPYSDLEMMEKTVDEYLPNYETYGLPFHAYYMTVSGHANWGWGNSMSAKNREAAQAAYPEASQTVQGYIAANLELEAAMSYLMERLEQAGALEDTVICLSADHYPYAMVTEDRDYYQELSGLDDSEADTSRYRNTLILWCGAMEEPVIIDTPCSSIDIVPTLSNLFGLTYDSRLFSGRDILADNYNPNLVSTNMPLVILPTTRGTSWITAAGTYEAKTNTFTANPGITVSDTYAESVSQLIDAKYSYSRLLIQYDYYHTVLEN